MANHKSAEKRIRSTATRQVQNHYQAKTMRNALKKMRLLKSKKEASEMLPKLSSMLDKLAKKNVIHKSKADNLKSKLTRMVNSLA